MRFAVFVKATKETEAGVIPKPEEFERMNAFNQTLVDDVTMLAGEGLQDSSKGARIRFEDGRTTVTEGPFAATSELVAGFWIVSAPSKAAVVERFKKAPFDGGQELEIRQIFEAEDFGENLPEEIRAPKG